MSKILSKYIAAFDYFDKTLIVLFETSGGITIIIFVSAIAALFSLTAGIVKKLFEIARTRKKKCNKFLMLAKIKLNRNETLISQTLIGLEIIHEEFKTIVKEKERSIWK